LALFVGYYFNFKSINIKPMQVFYIMLLIYGTGPWIKRFLGSGMEKQ